MESKLIAYRCWSVSVDILPALKDGDSHCWTVMSDRGRSRDLIRGRFIGSSLPCRGILLLHPSQSAVADVHCRVHIAVVLSLAG